LQTISYWINISLQGFEFFQPEKFFRVRAAPVWKIFWKQDSRTSVCGGDGTGNRPSVSDSVSGGNRGCVSVGNGIGNRPSVSDSVSDRNRPSVSV
jgi:hypothetical protein